MNKYMVLSRRVRRSNRRGAVLVLFAISVAMLIGICALVIDLGVAYVAAGQLQNIADASALAGVQKLRDGLDYNHADHFHHVKTEAEIVAALNSVLKDQQLLNRNTDIVIGGWDAINRRVVPWTETMDAFAVQVTARRTTGSLSGPIPTFFARIWGIDDMDVARTGIAGLEVRRVTREPKRLMIVLDGSGSFVDAWSKAAEANTALLELINGVSVEDDAAGMMTFNARLDPNWLRNSASYRYLYNDYVINYPEMNEGLKYTTHGSGLPRKTNDIGITDPGGEVRPMAGPLTEFDANNTTDLPIALDKASQLLRNGLAWGDTDTGFGLNYGIDRLLEHGGGGENVILLISDGLPNDVRGASWTNLRRQSAIAAADRAADHGIKIHAVTLEGTGGAAYGFNEGLVRNGASLRAANADDLLRIVIGIGTIEYGSPRLVK